MTSRTKWAKSLLGAAVIIGNCFWSFTASAEVSSAELKKVEKEVLAQSLEHQKLQAQANKIKQEIASINREMIKAAGQIQNSEVRLSQMEKQLETLKTELAEAQNGFSKEDDHLIKTLAALQNLALKPTESLLVQPLSPVDIIRSAMILRETIPYLEANAERIRNQLQDIENKKKKIETQISEISKQKIVMQTERKRMIALVQRKSQLGNSVEIKSQKAKENMDKLASQAKNLRDLLNKIEQQRKERAAREAAERKRREEERRKLEEKQSDDLIKSERESITNIASGFAKAKGTLPMPARGTIISHYGEQKNGVSSKGLIVATRARAQVIAPFDGAVVFAGPFRGYGNMIIVEHDNGYLSLLSGLGSIDVELGQMLLAGEPVGQMPSGDKAELYIEIRKDNQPINPAAWFKI